MSTGETTPAVDQPCASHGEPPLHVRATTRAPPTALAAFQEHVQVLRQHLVGAEQTLDTADPEDVQLLKKALIQVSKMISQMESVANTLGQRRRNLRNELRTLEDENSQLKKALFRERSKALNKNANDSPLREQRKISPPPSFYRGDSSVDYDSLRQFLFAPAILRFPPADENESMVDFLFDGPDSSASTSKVSSASTSKVSSCLRRQSRTFWKGQARARRFADRTECRQRNGREAFRQRQARSR
ncbi:uncharacterized protein LOC119464957 [Dermacentor silvarum]|uniref:uncharacterized protein LOC119464957 n=1 Tax=Dermacentor silvarum TaxID=543639 RepID=UPI0021019550|nr:uncharacterized protein LOC119464957 [Dermacentor silvarum]